MTTATALLNRRLLELAQHNERVRCSDPVDHQRWTSDNAEDRAIAMLWCNGCVVLTLCGDAADERNERHGVWAGVDRTTR
jgi:hypothetical protein